MAIKKRISAVKPMATKRINIAIKPINKPEKLGITEFETAKNEINGPAKATTAMTGRITIIKLEWIPYFFADSNDITAPQNQNVAFCG
jgi:hypothetical protein